MSSVDERINSVMLSFIRKRVPEADVVDFETPMYDLDMDSLDVVDLSNALDEEYGVKADLERVSECITPSDLRAYFRELIDAT